jgi:hypothetical protein
MNVLLCESVRIFLVYNLALIDALEAASIH